jgi:hypothetical protein
MTTKAEAVNSALRRLGKPDQAEPHATKTTYETAEGPTGSSSASFAERFLNSCDLSTQTTGWYFNTEYDVEVTPNGSKKIPLPTPIGDSTGAILRIDGYGTDAGKNIIIRDDSGTLGLFDLNDNTFEFGSSMKVIYTYQTRFDYIPTPFVDYMVAKAAYELNAAFLFNPKIQSILGQEIARTEAMMRMNHNEQEDWNVLGTPSAAAIRGRSNYTTRKSGTTWP